MIFIEEYQLFVDVEVTDFKTNGEELGFDLGKDNDYYRVNLHFYSFDDKTDRISSVSTFQPFAAIPYSQILNHAYACVNQFKS